MAFLKNVSLILSIAALSPVIFTSTIRASTIIYQDVHQIQIVSGPRSNTTGQEATVFTQVVDVAKAPWIRLVFNSVHLDGNSYLKIKSIKDGSTQIHTARSLAEWENTTAYFNGSGVIVELVAAPQSAGNFVEINQVITGDLVQPPQPAEPAKVCDSIDTRVQHNNPATARLLITNSTKDPSYTSGCTGFIISVAPNSDTTDRLMLSAGHCFEPGARHAVVQFDVPNSNTNCFLEHPGAVNQFYVNGDFLLAVSNGVGDDWAVFRCFKNSNTNKTIHQEQNAQFTMDTPAVSLAVRKYGYGVDGSANDPDSNWRHCWCVNGDSEATKSQTQQTSTGTITAKTGNRVHHDIHTCGGDSGSPIAKDSDTTKVVAIHMAGNCDSIPPNSGTDVNHPNLQAAINSIKLGSFKRTPLLSSWGLIALSLSLILTVFFVWHRRRKLSLPVALPFFLLVFALSFYLSSSI